MANHFHNIAKKAVWMHSPGAKFCFMDLRADLYNFVAAFFRSGEILGLIDY